MVTLPFLVVVVTAVLVVRHRRKRKNLNPATLNPSDAPRDFKSIVLGTKPLTVTEKFIIGFHGTQFELNRPLSTSNIKNNVD